MRKALAALAILFLVAHLPFLPDTFDDLDGINFALGVRDFDVTLHQPHPPGYPVFIAMSKVSTRALEAAAVAGAEAKGLALWSVLCGVLMVPALFALFRALEGSDRRAWWATLLTMTCPLVWVSALRPLSDMAGLSATLIAQGLLVGAITSSPSPRRLLAGALAAGLAIGIRSQTFTLTLPLLMLALLLPGTVASFRTRLAALAACAAGVLVWAVPVFIASGGLSAYLGALSQQGGEDFGGVVMFWNFPTPAVGLSALRHTFISPWASVFLASAVLAAASAGLVSLWRDWKIAIIGAAMALPYAIFHLLFHETVTVRYALPLVPAIAWLAVRGIGYFARPAMPVVVAGLALWSLVLAIPAGIKYGAADTPIFQAIRDLANARREAPVAVATHRRIFTESRRARMWLREQPGAWLQAPRDFEWLEVTRIWRSGGVTPAWFFADPRRTDLALIDSRRARIVPYRWPFADEVFVGGARPGVFDVHIYDRPGWFLEEGWALTPETAGISAREGWLPHLRPSVGWIQGRDTAAEMMLGGRHLGRAGDPSVRLAASIDGRSVLDVEIPPGLFVHRLQLPPGSLAGEGRYARLEVTSGVKTGTAPRLELEQFDVQSEGVPMFAVQTGWQEAEYKPETGLSWRWMSSRGELWVRPIGRDVRLTLSAESPLKYFGAAPVLRMTLGGEEVGRLSPSDDFTWEVVLPAAKLARSDGRLLVESDQSFVPGGPDQRNLAIRVFRISVN